MNNGTKPFAAFEWQLAARYVRAKRAERFVSVISIISLIGIALGVATLIIVMGVMGGFRLELTSRMLGLNGHIIVEGIDGTLPDYGAALTRIRSIPGITSATPLVEGHVLASQNNVSYPVKIRGIAPADLAAQTAVTDKLTPGSLERFPAPDTVIVGTLLAQRLGLMAGGSVTLTSADTSSLELKSVVRNFALAGIFAGGGRQADDDVLFMPLDQAQSYFGLDNAVTEIEIMLADHDRAVELVPLVQQAVGPGARVLPWQVTNSVYFGALTVERNVMALILTLMILLAAMNLVSSFVMLVKDKAGDIAILRTMGTTRGSVMRVFLVAGAGIGVTGTLIGFAIGILVCKNFALFRPLLGNLFVTPLLDPAEISFVVIVSLGLSFLATLIPSWRAARLDPVEALRYE